MPTHRMPTHRLSSRPGLALALLALIPLAAACTGATDVPPEATATTTPSDSLAAMDRIAEEYVRLVLELGTHDEGYVDAYYGPEEVRRAAEASPRPVAEIGRRADQLSRQAAGLEIPGETAAAGDGAPPELLALRRTFLAEQLAAIAARARMLEGAELSFDEESQALYDAVAPHDSEAHFDEILTEVDAEIPGEGPLAGRYARWRDGFVIPPERLGAVFDRAIEECRRRTAAHIELPAGEGFRVEYVTDKPWSGYNWFQGGYQSLIQVNTDLPIYIDRAIDLACHEGYPGHHVYNSLLEKHLVDERGWVEYTVYPLYSPESLIAEGSANYGIRVAFPGDERQQFESRELFPLAGLDPARAERYYAVARRLEKLSYAGNEAARRYLDGEIDRAEAERWLTRYTLSEPDRAAQRVRFFDAYRSYVINYNLGQDLVRRWVERQLASRPDAVGVDTLRWQVFRELLTTPRVASELTEDGGPR